MRHKGGHPLRPIQILALFAGMGVSINYAELERRAIEEHRRREFRLKAWAWLNGQIVEPWPQQWIDT